MPSKDPKGAVPLTMLNGEVGATLNIQDRALSYGDGVFETMRVVHGLVPLLTRHLQRLEHSCARLKIPYDAILVAKELNQFLQCIARQPHSDGVLKLVFSRGVGGQGYYPPLPEHTSPTRLCIFTPMLLEPPAKATLETLSVRLKDSPSIAGLKHLNRLEYVMAAMELSCREKEHHGLFLSGKEQVVETMHHNLFMIQRGFLVTPTLTSCGVKGVMRQLIIDELAEEAAMDVVVRDFTLDELYLADEVFICNAVRGIQPVTAVDSQVFVGSLETAKLVQCLEQRWH